MAFALQKLRDVARSEQRTGSRRADSLDDDNAPEPSTEADVAEEILNRELRRRLRMCAREFVRRHPRATLQFAAVWLKFIDGLDDQEIARRLGKPVSAIHVLRARGVAKLRLDDQWRALAREFELAGMA